LNKTTEKITQQHRPKVPVEDLLTYKGQVYKQNIAVKEQRLNSREQSLRASIKVNHVSERLMRERLMQQGETSESRLSRPIGTVKEKTLQEIQQELTFHPKIGNSTTSSIRFNGSVLPRSHSERYIGEDYDDEMHFQQHTAGFEYGSHADFFDLPVQGGTPYDYDEGDYSYNSDDSGSPSNNSNRNNSNR